MARYRRKGARRSFSRRRSGGSAMRVAVKALRAARQAERMELGDKKHYTRTISHASIHSGNYYQDVLNVTEQGILDNERTGDTQVGRGLHLRFHILGVTNPIGTPKSNWAAGFRLLIVRNKSQVAGSHVEILSDIFDTSGWSITVADLYQYNWRKMGNTFDILYDKCHKVTWERPQFTLDIKRRAPWITKFSPAALSSDYVYDNELSLIVIPYGEDFLTEPSGGSASLTLYGTSTFTFFG